MLPSIDCRRAILALGLLFWTATVVGASALPAAAQDASRPAATKGQSGLRLQTTALKNWTGDFDGMVGRRVIRVGTPYSRSLYYHDKGHERGLTVMAVRQFETFINKKHKKTLEKRPLTVVLIPMTRDQLVPALLDGRIDIAAGNITITDDRRERVDFSQPMVPAFSEIVVTGPKAPKLESLDDLSGKDVFVRKATSYYESMAALNEKFAAAGKPPAKLIDLPDPIEDEDKLDMVNAGLLSIVLVDEWLGDLWKPKLPNVTLRKDLVTRANTEIAWAFRQDSPQLEAEVNDFIVKVIKKIGLNASNVKGFFAKTRNARPATDEAEIKRFQDLVELFRTYGSQYKFDPLMLAAQGFQESQLKQDAKSHVGAVGVMQVMPATGKELKVGDISKVEPNIHAGAKYMDRLMKVYFPHAELDETNRTLFAFASYNAGPSRVARLRKTAEKEGYDPNQWFNNVERVVAKKVGQEPVTYVRNIYKYYVSYRLAADAMRAAREATATVAPAKQ